MKILKILGVLLFGFSLIASLFIYRASAAEINNQEAFNSSYHYQVVNQSKYLWLESGETDFLQVTIQNTSRYDWPIKQLFLGSVFFDGTADRPSQFATPEWINENRIRPNKIEGQEVIRPRGQVSFNVPVKAVPRNGIYKESFKPVLEHIRWIDGQPIEWLIQIGDELSYSNLGKKQIQIWLDDQRLWAIEDHVIILNISVSTGLPRFATPKGLFKILYRKELAYAADYGLWMDHWMAITSLKYGYNGVGIHRLPYWNVNPAKYPGKEGQVVNGRLYIQGKLYEGYSSLGKKMSHGCIRTSINASQVLYDWAEDGTLVAII